MSAKVTKDVAPKRRSRLPGFTFCTALAPLLAVQLGVLWLLQDNAGVTLPDFVDVRVKAKLAAGGIVGEWSKARISLSGRIELSDARIGAVAGDPVFEAKRLVAVLDPYDLLFSGKITPLRLWLDDGRLLCPAYGSPSGAAEPALEQVRVAARREGDRLIVETLQARCAGIPIVAHGRLLPSIAKAGSGTKSKTPANPLRMVTLAAAKIIGLRPELRRLEGASLELTGTDIPGGVKLSLDGALEHARYAGVVVHDVRLHIGAIWDEPGPRPDGRAVFVIGSATVERPASADVPAIRAETGRVSLRADFAPDWSLPTAANLTAHNLTVNGNPLDRLDLLCDWSEKTALKVRADALWRLERIAAEGVVNTDTGETSVDYSARLTLAEAREYPAFPTSLPPLLASMRTYGHTALSGRLELGRGGKFKKVFVDAETGAVHVGALDLLAFSAKADITPDAVDVRDIDGITATSQRIRGSFSSGFADDAPYRVTLRGDVFPQQVKPFVGVWWDRIWRDLAVDPAYPAHADVDVAGKWDGLPYEFINIGVDARRLSYQGLRFDRASVRIIETPDRLSVGDLIAKNDDGTGATGRLEWVYKLPAHKLDSIRFEFHGKLPLGSAAQLGGKDVVAAVSDITLKNPADATVIGRYDGPAGEVPDREALEVRVASSGPFTAWKIPGEDFNGVVLVDGPRIRVKDASFRYARGAAKADVWVRKLPEGFRVTFDTAFDKADRTAFFDGLGKLKDTPPAPKTPAKPEPESVADDAKESGGLKIGIPGILSIDTTIGATKPEAKAKGSLPAKPELSGRLFARIRLPDINSLDGTGRVETVDRELFRVPLFGAVTLGLAKMGINAGNYRFDSASSDITIRDGSVWFPNLSVRGPLATVKAAGHYQLADDQLFFRAILNPKSPDTIPLLSWVKDQMNKTTRLFPVDIRGTLDKPEWSVDPSPGGLFSSQLDKSLGQPPPPPEDDGKW